MIFSNFKISDNTHGILNLPITPSCCGDKGAASPPAPPEPIEPEASDSLSLKPRGLLRPPLLATDPMPAK